jgi:hypothetical protein
MFHGEREYPMMMQVLHLNFIILFKWLFYHQCEELCNTFIYLNQYVGHVILRNIQIGRRSGCNLGVGCSLPNVHIRTISFDEFKTEEQK